jgi:hypothetical protein
LQIQQKLGVGNNYQPVTDTAPETQAAGVLPEIGPDVAPEDVFKSLFLARTGDSEEMIWFRSAILGGVICGGRGKGTSDFYGVGDVYRAGRGGI